MKPVPKSPEFERFTEALRRLMSVPKSAVQSKQAPSGASKRGPKPKVVKV